MAELDLTLREIEEAKTFGLSTRQYDDLKSRFFVRWRDTNWPRILEDARKDPKLRKEVADEIRATIRENLSKELKEKLTNELRADVRAEIQKTFMEKEREKLLVILREEQEAEVPTKDEIAAAQEFVREIELDCLTKADAASVMVEDAKAAKTRSRSWRNPIFYTLLISILPLVLYLNQVRGWTFNSASFWGVVASYIMTFIVLWAGNSSRFRTLDKHWEAAVKTLSSYRIEAERAKRARLVGIDAARTREQLSSTVDTILHEKRSLDKDFHPSTSSLTRARVSVRDSLLTDMDPEKLFSVATEGEEDERDQPKLRRLG